MRAELLRLTEVLRQMVKDENSADEVTREAENLIKTRVEPVVREARQAYRGDYTKPLPAVFSEGINLLWPDRLRFT